MIKKIIRIATNILKRRSNLEKISKYIQNGLPKQMEPVLKYLVTGNSDAQTTAVINRAETRRKEIASEGDKKISIWYSPKPESAGNDSSITARPQPGKVLDFTMKKIASTGKRRKWGVVLYLIAREFKPAAGIELGTCAGISAIYLSSAPNIKKFITVEGSEALANIAQESLKSFDNVKVVNSLFDEAIDHELPLLDSKIDIAYIDGHHEKIATIHYFNRLIPFLNPGAAVIFDDISWSYDMRDAWNILKNRYEFAHAMDLGEIGVCILKTEHEDSQTDPTHWDLQPIVGKTPIGEPHGWKE